MGSSAGSVVGTLYAAGYGAFDIQELALEIEKDLLFDWTLPNRGFIDGSGLEKTINEKVNGRKIQELNRSLVIVATNLHTGELTTFMEGNTGAAVRASCSVPAIFRPTKIGEAEFVDGGVASPLPVEVARKVGADIVIAVNISSIPSNHIPKNTIEVLRQVLDIMGGAFAEKEARLADIVITPNLTGIGSTDFESKNLAILEGERAGFDAIGQIKKLISDFSVSLSQD